MEWGDKEDFLWEVYINKDVEPEALANKPDIPFFLASYIEAFSLLSVQRERTMDGPQPIRLSEMIIYASEYDVYDRELFIRHICIMDIEYRVILAKRRKNSG